MKTLSPPIHSPLLYNACHMALKAGRPWHPPNIELGDSVMVAAPGRIFFVKITGGNQHWIEAELESDAVGLQAGDRIRCHDVNLFAIRE